MPDRIASRRDLFRVIAGRITANHERLERTGVADREQLKVFWLEVNRPATNLDGWASLERDLFEYVGQPPMWLDSSHERIWYLYTFGERKDVRQALRRSLFGHGVDNVWLAEPFLERLRRRTGYDGRGFRLAFRDSLTQGPDQPAVSAKFWLGRNVPAAHEEFLGYAQKVFSKSSLRLGRSKRDDPMKTGLLIEVRAEGNMTVTTCEDPEEILGFVRAVGEDYSAELRSLEKRRQASPRPIELDFKTPIDLAKFQQMVEAGVGGTRLWLQRIEQDGDLHRYLGADLHTNEILGLDISPQYAYVNVRKSGCMNVAPRMMTISAQKLSGKTEMFYEGERVFA